MITYVEYALFQPFGRRRKKKKLRILGVEFWSAQPELKQIPQEQQPFFPYRKQVWTPAVWTFFKSINWRIWRRQEKWRVEKI